MLSDSELDAIGTRARIEYGNSVVGVTWNIHDEDAAVRRAVANAAAKNALEEAAKHFDAEYERLTLEFGAYGQMKVRAAYRLSAVLLAERAASIPTTTYGADNA